MNFIYETIATRGWINRADICEKFRVSLPQAALDFRHARKLWPHLMTYDTHAKRYVRNTIRAEDRCLSFG